MLATVTRNGETRQAQFFGNPFQAIEWLIMQRLAYGETYHYRIEDFDGYVIHTL